MQGAYCSATIFYIQPYITAQKICSYLFTQCGVWTRISRTASRHATVRLYSLTNYSAFIFNGTIAYMSPNSPYEIIISFYISHIIIVFLCKNWKTALWNLELLELLCNILITFLWSLFAFSWCHRWARLLLDVIVQYSHYLITDIPGIQMVRLFY